jgi:hypothetical protein
MITFTANGTYIDYGEKEFERLRAIWYLIGIMVLFWQFHHTLDYVFQWLASGLSTRGR